MKIKVHGLQNLFIFYVSIWVISPILAYGTAYRVLAIISVVMWFFLEFYNKSGILKKPSPVLFLVFTYIFYTVLFGFLAVDDFSFTQNFQLFIMFFFLLVYESRKNHLYTLSWIVWGVLLIYPVWFYITIEALDSIGGYVSRVIVRSSEDTKELTQQGIGGYGLVYSGLLLFPVMIGLFCHLLNVRSSVLKSKFNFNFYLFVVVVNIVFIFLLIFKAGYSVAIISLFFSSLIIFIMNKFSYIRMCICVFFCIFVFLFYKNIVFYFSEILLLFTDNPIYIRKINDVVVSLASDSSAGTVSDRVSVYSKSLFAFFHNPFVGVLNSEEIGGHSFILDNYAKWGIVFGSILFYFIIFIPLKYLAIKSSSFGVCFAIVFVILAVFSLNTQAGSFGVVLYLITPYFYYFIKNYGIKKSTLVNKDYV